MVAALAGLFTLIGLNLVGVFEFGNMLPTSVASLQARHPVADSFLTGVLAVAVASPCTAPFMGASMGLTATLPAAQALAGLHHCRVAGGGAGGRRRFHQGHVHRLVGLLARRVLTPREQGARRRRPDQFPAHPISPR